MLCYVITKVKVMCRSKKANIVNGTSYENKQLYAEFVSALVKLISSNEVMQK